MEKRVPLLPMLLVIVPLPLISHGSMLIEQLVEGRRISLRLQISSKLRHAIRLRLH